MFNSYNSILILIITVLLYFVSFYLVKKNKIKLLTHRKIWNIVLLFSFLISGLIGLILAILIDYNIYPSWYSKILWTHVEFGIVMAIISIFHIVWHINYYKNIIKK